jgi:hypothetical protein
MPNHSKKHVSHAETTGHASLIGEAKQKKSPPAVTYNKGVKRSFTCGGRAAEIKHYMSTFFPLDSLNIRHVKANSVIDAHKTPFTLSLPSGIEVMP